MLMMWSRDCGDGNGPSPSGSYLTSSPDLGVPSLLPLPVPFGMPFLVPPSAVFVLLWMALILVHAIRSPQGGWSFAIVTPRWSWYLPDLSS
jgi:hypothetical protein